MFVLVTACLASGQGFQDQITPNHDITARFPVYFSPSVGIYCLDSAGQESLSAFVGDNECKVNIYYPENMDVESVKIKIYGIFEGEKNTLIEFGKIKEIAHKDFGEFNYPISSLKKVSDYYSINIPKKISMEPYQTNIEMLKTGFSKYKTVVGLIDVTDPLIAAYTGGFSLKTIGQIVASAASLFSGDVQPTWIQAVVYVCDSSGLTCSTGGTNWIAVR